MIKVYHNSDFLDVAFMFGTINNGSAAWARKDQLEHVANVHVPDAEYGEAFRLTNHIDSPWQENAEVEALVSKARSTSVGDVIELSDGRLLICRSVGWDEYPESQKELGGFSPVNSGCPACSGKVNPITVKGMAGVCSDCGGKQLSKDSTLASRWCTCSINYEEQYYWREDGRHGWMCSSCHGIKQVG